MEHHPGRLVALHADLPLEREGRQAALVGDHQEGREEPEREVSARAVEDGARRRRGLVAAGRALADATPGDQVGPLGAAQLAEPLQGPGAAPLGKFGPSLTERAREVLGTR